MNKIRVAIADDHGLVRQGLVSMLSENKDLEVVGTVDSGEAAVNFANEHTPDVFLMDIMMKGMTGIEATRWIKERNPQVRIILVSSEVNKDYIAAGIKSGIDGYLPKETDKEMLIQAIHAVMRGERYFDPDITALVFQDFYLKEKEGKGLPTKKNVRAYQTRRRSAGADRPRQKPQRSCRRAVYLHKNRGDP